MRVNEQQLADRLQTIPRHESSYFYTAISQVCVNHSTLSTACGDRVGRNHFQISGTVIHAAIHDQSEEDIAFLVTSDHQFTQAVLYNIVLMSGMFLISHPYKVGLYISAVSFQAHFQTASFACSTAGITNKE